jgi:hypothetical protein
MWGTKIHYRQMWARGAVIEETTHEGRTRVRILAAAKHMIFEPKLPRLRSWQLFYLKSSFGSYRLNRPVGGRQVRNDLGRRNYQNDSCRSLKFMKLRSWRLFDLKSSCGPYRANRPVGLPPADRSKMTSDGETTKMKVVDLEKLWNFAVHNFFIWNRLGRQTINLCSV